MLSSIKFQGQVYLTRLNMFQESSTWLMFRALAHCAMLVANYSTVSHKKLDLNVGVEGPGPEISQQFPQFQWLMITSESRVRTTAWYETWGFLSDSTGWEGWSWCDDERWRGQILTREGHRPEMETFLFPRPHLNRSELRWCPIVWSVERKSFIISSLPLYSLVSGLNKSSRQS